MAEKSRKDQQCSGLREFLQDVNRQPFEYIVLPLRKVTQPSLPDAQLSKYYADLLWTSTKMDPCSSDFWRQRRLLCKKLGTKAASVELLVTKNHLYMDGRNENVWYHRKWVPDTFGGWENELEFCTGLLQRDTYNEHAWVQRFFVILRCKIGIAEFDYSSDDIEEDLDDIEEDPEVGFPEFDYVFDAIVRDPENEYPWRYLCRLYEQIQGHCFKISVGNRLDSLFIRVINTRYDSGWAFRFTEREWDSDDIRMNITMHSKIYLCAMEALIHLLLLGYSPSKTVQDALDHICPATEKKSTPVEQILYRVDGSIMEISWR